MAHQDLQEDVDQLAREDSEVFKDQWDQPEMWVFQDNLDPEEIVDQSDPKVHVVVMDLQARMALQELKVHPVCLDLREYLAHQERKELQAPRDWLDQREIRVQKVHKVHLDCVVLSDPVGRLVLKDLQENVVNAETKVCSVLRVVKVHQEHLDSQELWVNKACQDHLGQRENQETKVKLEHQALLDHQVWLVRLDLEESQVCQDLRDQLVCVATLAEEERLDNLVLLESLEHLEHLDHKLDHQDLPAHLVHQDLLVTRETLAHLDPRDPSV